MNWKLMLYVLAAVTVTVIGLDFATGVSGGHMLSFVSMAGAYVVVSFVVSYVFETDPLLVGRNRARLCLGAGVMNFFTSLLVDSLSPTPHGFAMNFVLAAVFTASLFIAGEYGQKE